MDALIEALKPFLREFDRLERSYGFDRPDHQAQCLMIDLIDIKRLRAAIPETNSEAGS